MNGRSVVYVTLVCYAHIGRTGTHLVIVLLPKLSGDLVRTLPSLWWM